MRDESTQLQDADRRIEDWRRLVAKQKLAVAGLQRDGHYAAGSITLLRAQEAALRALHDERGLIVRRLKRREFLENLNEVLAGDNRRVQR